jgi:hypothetical protein
MSDHDPFAPVPGRGKPSGRSPSSEWEIVLPVPPDAPPPFSSHPTLGKPTAIWTYTDQAGGVLGYVHRYDGPDGKQFFPVTLWQPTVGGAPTWRWKSWPPKRPLYGLRRLAERLSAPVVITEGEKSADAASRLLPGFAAVSAPNGAKSADKADWSVLKGRTTTLWPDADLAGARYMEAVASAVAAAGALSVAIIPPPSGVVAGWDAADAEADGWTEAQASALVESAVPAMPKESRSPRGRRPRQRDDLIAAVLGIDGFELWHDAGREGYATIPVNGHLEHRRLKSSDFENWLSYTWYCKTGNAPSSPTLEEVKRTFATKAVNEGRKYQPFVRVGAFNGKVYLDLCDDRWRAVEIGRDEWAVIDRPPIKFLRSPSMRELPEPEAGETIKCFRRFVNVTSEDDYRLIVHWMVAALRSVGPFPILIVNGTQGSGKSFLCQLLRSVIDPDLAPVCAAPMTERDLFLAGSNTWICAYDNLSEVSGFLPDALCRVATGGGLRTRSLHTNREETVFFIQRPLILNGIPSLVEQADVARRAIVITLGSIDAKQRQTEADLWKDFEKVRPYILGALLNAVSRGLRDLDSVQLDRPGSMADFEKFSMASASALDWKAEEFRTAYRNNENSVAEEAFEADAFAIAVHDFALNKHPDGYEGAPAALLIGLDEMTPERIRKSRSWPKSPAQLGNRMNRATPVLKHKGFTIERRRSGTRSIIIVPPKKAAKQNNGLSNA